MATTRSKKPATAAKSVISKLAEPQPKKHVIRYDGDAVDPSKLPSVYVPKELLAKLTDDPVPPSITVTITVP